MDSFRQFSRTLLSTLSSFARIPCIAAPFLVLSSVTASGADKPVEPEKPVIEFKVLLIIKKKTEAWSPLFLPVRAEMSNEEIAAARRCFEIETPDMVRSITGGKVRFVPTVYISQEPLRQWSPQRLDSAEIYGDEMFTEFSKVAKPGQFDSVGYYFLPRDPKSGYSIPRAGYGVGWFDKSYSVGAFAIHAAEMNPRDEIFLHEWIHGLEGFYNGKPNVRLTKGWLHGTGNYPGYKSRIFRNGDTFWGWMDWYKDILNCEVKESNGTSGLGAAAWAFGPMRNFQPAQFPQRESAAKTPGTYPDWLQKLMEGNPASAKLGPNLLEDAAPKSKDDLGSWKMTSWTKDKSNVVERVSLKGITSIRIQSVKADDLQLERSVQLAPLKNYILSAEVKTNKVKITQAGGKASVQFGLGSARATKKLLGTSNWTPVSICFTTGEKVENGSVQLGLGGRGSLTEGEVSFRNLSVRQVLYPEQP